MSQEALNLVHAFKQFRPHEVPVVGGMTAALRQLPESARPLVIGIGDAVAAQRELGRHGNVEKVLDEWNVPKELRPTVEKMVSAVETDDLAVSLQRRMGTDANLPPPPVTSRDQVAAAYDLHSQGEL